MDLLATAGRPLRARRGPPLHPALGAGGVAAAARRRHPVLRDYHRHGRLLDAGTVEQAEASAAAAWLADTLAGRRSLLLVDTNEQAARLSAQLRAELVRLGRVAGSRGAARAAGHLRRGRRPGPGPPQRLGARRLRGQPPRPDQPRDLPGDSRSATTAGSRSPPSSAAARTGGGSASGWCCPPAYVAEHLALGYATTVHAAQGVTVDTSHTVVTAAHRRRRALYVGLSRGRDANTAHVATVTGVDDAAQGGERRTPCTATRSRCSPRSSTTTDDARRERSALATATESADEAASRAHRRRAARRRRPARRHRTHRDLARPAHRRRRAHRRRSGPGSPPRTAPPP